ncbi:hypothetical protein OAS73_02760 [Luminiphilus sp.]|nr:hypothetical protein [Luminiphilus sp.]
MISHVLKRFIRVVGYLGGLPVARWLAAPPGPRVFAVMWAAPTGIIFHHSVQFPGPQQDG